MPVDVPASDPSDSAARHQRWHHDKRLLLMVLLGFLVGLEFLENGMFVFAASYIVGGVHAGPRAFAQVQAAYAVGTMVMIVMQQSLSRHFGYRRYLTASLAVVVAGAVAAAAAQGVTGLVLARLVQGFGGGALFTSSRILVPMLFGARERGRAIRFFMLILFGMSACAPLLAATLTEWLGWRSILVSAVPLALLAMAGCWWLLPDGAGRGGTPVRWAAGPLLVVAAALTLLQLGLSEANLDLAEHPWRLALTALAGLVLLLVFLRHQWHHDEPLMRLSELRHPVYLTGLVLYFLHYLLSNASNYLFPMFAEHGLGLSLATTGWLGSFSALVGLACAWGYIRLASRWPNKKPLMAAGALAMVVSASLFAWLPADASPAALLPGLVAKGVFGVLLVLPVAGLTFRDLGEDAFAHGYQSKNLMRQLAGSFAAAVAAIALQQRQLALGGHGQHGLSVDPQTLLAACQDIYRVLALAAVLVTAVVLLQRRLK